ncbi:MAG: NAD(P)-dependent oxidoreductase, partial [Desulfobacterales bacterium]|nr:NAD(P)-dependent oxidoreductase [Desulfobacterales bacterium]
MKNIGIFYPGEMGGVLCKKLVKNDFHVFSSVSERSPKTRQSAIQNGAILKDTIEDVILSSDIIFSLVPPSRAVSLATEYINICSSIKKKQIFIDCNSISPSTVLKIANILKKDSIDFLDGAFIGSSNLIDTKTKLFLCGHRAVEVVKLLKGTIQISAISSQIGKASELKMCFAGFNKSLIALFLEFAYAGFKAGNWQDLS